MEVLSLLLSMPGAATTAGAATATATIDAWCCCYCCFCRCHYRCLVVVLLLLRGPWWWIAVSELSGERVLITLVHHLIREATCAPRSLQLITPTNHHLPHHTVLITSKLPLLLIDNSTLPQPRPVTGSESLALRARPLRLWVRPLYHEQGHRGGLPIMGKALRS